MNVQQEVDNLVWKYHVRIMREVPLAIYTRPMTQPETMTVAKCKKPEYNAGFFYCPYVPTESLVKVAET